MDAEVAVLGVGSVGSMALWQLATAGITAIGFEQYGIGHDQAAAGGESRIFRTAYLEGPEYVPILQRSYDLWRQLETESSHDLLTLTGGLMIGQEGSDGIANVMESITDFNLDHEILDSQSMAQRFPQHKLMSGEIAVLDTQAGVLRPEFAVSVAAQAAQAKGAIVHSRTCVEAIEPHSDAVTIHTTAGRYKVGQAIITAGPWTTRLVPTVPTDITPHRIVMTWYLARQPDKYRPQTFPIFVRDTPDSGIFGIPTLDAGSVKVAPHTTYGTVPNPDQLDRSVPVDQLTWINQTVSRYLPGLIPEPVRVSAYMDGYTSDGHGIVGPVPDTTNLWVLSGFSGHGFKMAPAFGQIARDLIQTGTTTLPVDHLRPQRFSDANNV